LTTESGSGNEQLVVQGKRGPILDGLFALRDKLFLKAVEKGDRGPANELGDLVGTLLVDVVNGVTISDSLKADLFRAYLYNWVDEIDAGIRDWAAVGLAFTKALFDAQSRRDLQNKVGAAFGADTLANTARANAEAGVGVLGVLIAELDDPNGDGLTDDSF